MHIRHIIREPSDVPIRSSMYRGLTVFLDLDETMVDARNYSDKIIMRPFGADFLNMLNKAGIEVWVWSAADYSHVHSCLCVIDPDGTKIIGSICRGTWWKNPVAKDILLVPTRSLNTSLLIDNTPYVSRFNPANSIIIPDFDATKKPFDGYHTILLELGRFAMNMHNLIISDQRIRVQDIISRQQNVRILISDFSKYNVSGNTIWTTFIPQSIEAICTSSDHNRSQLTNSNNVIVRDTEADTEEDALSRLMSGIAQ